MDILLEKKHTSVTLLERLFFILSSAAYFGCLQNSKLICVFTRQDFANFHRSIGTGISSSLSVQAFPFLFSFKNLLQSSFCTYKLFICWIPAEYPEIHRLDLRFQALEISLPAALPSCGP